MYNYSENGEYIYRNIMEKKIELIDPAINVAEDLYEYLYDNHLFNTANLCKSEFYISIPNPNNKRIKVDSDGNFTYGYKYGRTAGEIQEYVKRVPFSKRSLDKEIIFRLSESVPSVFRLIRCFNQNNSKSKFLDIDEKI